MKFKTPIKNEKGLNKEFIKMLESMNMSDTPAFFINGFINGKCYISQDPDVVDELRKYFTANYGEYYTGRVLCDTNSPLYEVFCRLYAIDINYKEWGQAYFALNANKGEDVCYNPEFENTILRKKRKRKLDVICSKIKK